MAVQKALSPLTTVLARGTTSPSLLLQHSQFANALHWLYFYYDSASSAKHMGKTRPFNPTLLMQGVDHIVSLIPYKIFQTLIAQVFTDRNLTPQSTWTALDYT